MMESFLPRFFTHRKPEHGEHDRADEVDDQILHRVDQTDVEVAAEAQVLAIDRDLGNVSR